MTKQLLSLVTGAFLLMTGCQSGKVSSSDKQNADTVTKEDAFEDETGDSAFEDNSMKLEDGKQEPERPDWVQPKGPYRPSRTLRHDLLHTRLEVSFNWEEEALEGKATLTLAPYFYAQDSLHLDAQGFDIHSLEIKDGKSWRSLKYHYPNNRKLHIDLGKTFEKGEEYKVRIDYTARPTSVAVNDSGDAIQSNQGLFFINPTGEKDGPQQLWTQGETEHNSRWFPTIDAPNVKTTEEIIMTVDKKFTTLSNGKKVNTTDNGDGTKAVHWKMDKPHAPYLFMMAVGNYEIVEDSWKGMDVNYYVEPEYAPYAKAVFGDTPEMLTFFSEKFGYEYPWSKYSQVVVRDFVSGAMENTTASVFFELLQMDRRQVKDGIWDGRTWDGIIAHELSHHWFGDLATCESWANLPMNEAFANYSEYLWAAHDKSIWQADYLNYLEQKRYLREAEQKRVPLIRYHYLDKEKMFDNHSYNKGGRVLHMLRNYTGDDAFFTALEQFLNNHEYKPVEVHDLRLAFEEVTGEDLNWFFNQWFMEPGHPELAVKDTFYNKKLHVSVRQVQDTGYSPVFKLPTSIAVWVNGKKIVKEITIDSVHEQFTFDLKAKPDLVLFDHDQAMLAKTDHKKSKEEYTYQFKNTNRFLPKLKAARQLQDTSLLGQKAYREMWINTLDHDFWYFRRMAVDLLENYESWDKNQIRSKIKTLALEDPKPHVQRRALRLLGTYYGKKELNTFEKALDDSAYSVVAAGLGNFIEYGDDKKIDSLINQYKDLPSPYIREVVAGYYTREKQTDKIEWFVNRLHDIPDVYMSRFLGKFFGYVSNAGDSEKFKQKGVEVLEEVKRRHDSDKVVSKVENYIEALQKDLKNSKN